MKNIRNMRQKANITQTELAQAISVTQSTIACWEAGTKYPSADKLPELARVLHCTIDNLFADEQEIEKEAV